MPRLSVSLAGGAGCRKQGCESSCGHLARHHMRHQAMWLGVWAGKRAREKRYREFVKRYREFRREDIVVLGANHHAEIHVLYDEIIERHKLVSRRNLANYSWEMADHLGGLLERACKTWLKEETPGFDHRIYDTLKHGGVPAKKLKAALEAYYRHRQELTRQFSSICIVQTVPTWRAE